jgi:uncharacterized protein YgbK (DUF1537 family)
MKSVIEKLPDEWPEDLSNQLQVQIRHTGKKVVVIDDDPTGTQTVHGINVLTAWSVAMLKEELTSDRPAFYLLSNSRSVPLEKAQEMNREIARNLNQAARDVGCEFVVVSRSDSTLRGHYPGEVDTLAESLGGRFDGVFIIPAFIEGNRVTVDSTHYILENNHLLPVNETEFAKDATFGYLNADLTAWVEEKTQGRVRAEAVMRITLDDLRKGGPEPVEQKILEMKGGQVSVVDTVTYRDLEVFVTALINAEEKGKRFLYRTSASFVRVRAGIEDKPLLKADEILSESTNGGLTVIGSYVPRSTRQLEELLALPDIVASELRVERILDPQIREQEIKENIEKANSAITGKKDTVIYTSRNLVSSQGRAGELGIGEKVSAALVECMRGITVCPSYLIAKGGITASDIAVKGLDVCKAGIRGQIIPGVPVWLLGEESRYPGLSYVVFPGNVGDDFSLANLTADLNKRRAEQGADN